MLRNHILAIGVLTLPALSPGQSPPPITEFATPTALSEPSFMTIGPDGALWFTEFTGNKIGRITTAGAITECPIPTAAVGPDGITAGPDGALRVTEYNLNKIGRITTAGAITEYLVPTAAVGP